MKRLLFFTLFLFPLLAIGQSFHWYQYGQQDHWHIQPDVYAFRMVGGQAYTGSIDSNIIEFFTYREERRDKANEIYFKSNSSIQDRQHFIDEIEQLNDFEIPYPVVTKNPLLNFSEESWYIIDDLILVNFRDEMSQENLVDFMSEYNLNPFHTPSNSLPKGGNYTYVFSLAPQVYKEQDAIDISALLIELDSGRVLEAAPNFVNIRLGGEPEEESTLKYSNVIPPPTCTSNDYLYPWSWYIDNPGGWVIAYYDAMGNPQNSPPAVSNADAGICECWLESLSGSGITIGIVSDGAFDYTHPDIGNYGLGWDCTGPCTSLDMINAPTEPDASGTYLASLVAAERNNSIGIAGIAYNATMNAYRINESLNTTSWTILIRTIQQALLDDVDVLMLGWMLSPGNSSVSQELDIAVNFGRNRNGVFYGMVIVATPGGGVNISQSTTSYPAAYPQVLSVIGTNPVDQLCTPGDGFDYLNPLQPYGSAYGSQYDIAAPTIGIWGHDITSGYGWATSGVGSVGNDYSPAPSHEQPYAAPTVAAGVAALLLENQGQVLWNDFQQIMQNGADQVGGYAYSSGTGKSTELGHGRVNCYNSLLLLDTPEGQDYQFDLEVVNPIGQYLKIVSQHGQGLKLQLKIYDLGGRSILAQSVRVEPGESIFPLPSMASGMYLLTLIGEDGGSFSRKLIKP